MARPPSHPAADDVTIARVLIERIRPLRHRVLRAGLPLESACFPGDEDPATLHLAAVAQDLVVGCATYRAAPYGGEPAYQLRGMAVDPAWQGRGIGRRLLVRAEELLSSEPIGLRWCNARATAIDFYTSQGWSVDSELFDIPTAGLHRRMVRRREAT